MSTWPYKRVFEKYKDDCEIFVETGTHKGESVADALELGFKLILSVEIEHDLFDLCMEKFKFEIVDKKVFLFQGDSVENFPKMLDMVNKRAMFWLDAHGRGNPFREELNLLLQHPIKNHVIAIDDIGNHDVDEGWIKETLTRFNPNYKFAEDHCAAKQLIAYI